MSALLVVTALTLTLCFGLAASRQSTGRHHCLPKFQTGTRMGCPED